MERREAMRFRSSSPRKRCRERNETRCASRRSMPLIVARGRTKSSPRASMRESTVAWLYGSGCLKIESEWSARCLTSPLWGGIGGLRPRSLKNADALHRLWRSGGRVGAKRSVSPPNRPVVRCAHNAPPSPQGGGIRNLSLPLEPLRERRRLVTLLAHVTEHGEEFVRLQQSRHPGDFPRLPA